MSKYTSLQERATSLPEDIKSYLFSIKASEINAQIFAVAGVEISKYTDISWLIADIILKDKPLSDLESKLQELLSWPPEKVASFAQEIIGSRLLVCDKWLGGEAEKYLRSKNADISHYAALVAEQQLAIAKEEAFFREQLEDDMNSNQSQEMDDVLSDDHEQEEDDGIEVGEEGGRDDDREDGVDAKNKENIDIEATKKSIIASLKDNVLTVFLTDNQVKVENYNYLFVRVWSEDKDFHLEAPNALLTNQEKISAAKLELDGKSKTATIAVLLKKFVKKYGLEANDLNIAEYVSSPDLKEFSDNEKALSLRVLKFFRNINKLDEYLVQQAAGQIEGFEVLPLAANQANVQSEAVAKPKPVLKSEPITKLTAIPAAAPVAAPVNMPVAATAPAPVSVNPSAGLAAELEMMLQDYAPGSLEYKTLQQELKRLAH